MLQGYNLAVIPVMSESAPNFTEVPTAEAFKTPRPTPLAALLVAEMPNLAVCGHEGTITPRFFDESRDKAGSELGDLLTSAAAVDFGWLGRIAVKGEDRTRWLAGMTTNAVQTLEEGHGNYNLVLNTQGRIQGDLYAFREQDRIVLETTAAQVDRLFQHLDHFIIMDDVELERVSWRDGSGSGRPDGSANLGKTRHRCSQLVPMQQLKSNLNGLPVTMCRSYSVLIPHFEIWVEEGRVAELWACSAQCRDASLRA